MKKRQYRSNQGRSPQQYESSAKSMLYATVVLLITLVGTLIYDLVVKLF